MPLNECHVASLIAVVEQETALFQGTAIENIQMSDPTATEEQARVFRVGRELKRRALRRAQGPSS